MKCWRCHSNSVNTRSHLPRGSDVKTRGRSWHDSKQPYWFFFLEKKVTSQTIINANKHRKLQISSKKLTQFSSPDPKGHVRYCHHLASVVVSKIIHFNLLLWNHLANWNQTWYGPLNSLCVRIRVMVFNATFNNISVIFVRKLEFPEKTTDLPQVTDKPLHEWDSNSQLLVYVFCWSEVCT
jgi:hypothetical protein